MKRLLARRQSNVQATATDCNNGYIRVYSGTVPANPNTALSGNTLLATGRYSATAFGAADGSAIATANAITQESSAPAAGTPSFARIFQSDGTTVVGDVTVGLAGSGTELILSTMTVGLAAVVTFPGQTLQEP